jgi:predicted nucleic acid-binding protein
MDMKAHTLNLFINHHNWKTQALIPERRMINSTNLDRGEEEAIALALSKKALLLMDEESGRKVAREQGLKVKGSLGVLIEAYHKKLISLEQLRFYFIQISNRKDIWISPQLCNRLLETLENQAL